MRKNRFHLLLGILAWGFIFFLLEPTVTEVTRDFFLRRSLSQDVEIFHRACLDGRATAIRERRAVGVNFGETGWTVFEYARIHVGPPNENEKLVSSGTWKSGTKLGSNIPSNRFYFLEDGTCYISPFFECKVDDTGDLESIAHFVAVTSDAPRIYTLFFDELGEPQIEYDDF